MPVPERDAFWPERLLQFGDGWILTYLSRPTEITSGDGEVWLMALDADFQILDTMQVSPEGTLSARPWVAWKGKQLAVSHDRDVETLATLVELQPDALPTAEDSGGDSGGSGDSGNIEVGDSGEEPTEEPETDSGIDDNPDSGEPGATPDTPSDPGSASTETTCGCRGGGKGLLFLPLLLALGRRRSDRSARRAPPTARRLG